MNGQPLFTIAWCGYLILHMTLSAYFSSKLNTTGDKTWFFLVWGLGLIPVWAIVSKFSRNIAADGMLYDTLITLVYYPALMYFAGTMGNTHWWHWLGFAMAIGGAFLVRM